MDGECAFTFIEQCSYSCQNNVDDIEMAGRTQNITRMWAKVQKKVDLEDPVSLLDLVYLGCTQRAAQGNTRIVMEKQKLLSKNVEIGEQNPKDITDTHGQAQKCVERCCELAHKMDDQLHKVSTPCLDDHQVRPEDLEIVVELSETCSPFLLNACILQELDDQIYFGN